MKITRSDVRAYLQTALWNTTDNSRDDGGDPLNNNWSVSDCSEALIKQAESDLDNFYAYVQEVAPDAYVALCDDEKHAAHDFWLSRNGHGAGFFDGDYDGHENTLQSAAKTFGSVDLYVDDDGMIQSN